MNPTDPRFPPALEAAITQIRTTTATVASRLCDSLGITASTTTQPATRDAVNIAQDELRRNLDLFGRTFHDALREKVSLDLGSRTGAGRKQAPTNWQALSLVNDSEVEERMNFDRIGQTISHACEWQLRELAAYMGTVTGSGRADEDRNPVRADVLGAALYRGIEAVSENADSRKVLARGFGLAMAEAMPDCYAEILRALQQRGVQPVELSVRTVEGPGNQLPGVHTGYTNLPPAGRTSTRGGQVDTGLATDLGGGPSRDPRRGAPVHDALAAMTGGGGPSYASTSRPSAMQSATDPARTGYQPTDTSQLDARGGSRYRMVSPADAQLMTLLRRLTAVASEAGKFNDAPIAHTLAGTSGNTDLTHLQNTNFGAPGPTGLQGIGEPQGNDPTGLMAVNLIKAHREELMQASTGKLDHMVIEVVGSLFDQILSDARVPPQMARQIARLQLPVLRVAMNDATFFSTRRHPVRRFINRIASLACAFDDFGEGPGRHFIAQVSTLVQEIVDGDFDQIDLYAAKLAELEGFIAEQTHVAADQTCAVTTLAAKESELRIQQRYMLQLQSALAPLQLPQYLADFLPQVWSQALVQATRQDGADSDRAARFRRVGRDLVMSIQPKGSPILRKRFLMQLPPLMKDLNEGMQLIGWPEAAQRDLLSKLLPAHAESLKSQPMSELDFNLMAKRLEGIFNAPIPGTESVSTAGDLPEVDEAVIEQRFTPEEAARVGLVQESAVDWDGHIDIDLSAEEPVESTAGTTSAPVALDSGAQALIAPNSGSGEPPEPSHGAQLIDHIQLGFAYQMHLKNEWQKVRLAHVSAGRGFFLFTRGAKHQETISMTSRMLARMCETGRMRAVESAYLMERATNRARRQLAGMKASATRH